MKKQTRPLFLISSVLSLVFLCSCNQAVSPGGINDISSNSSSVEVLEELVNTKNEFN